MGSAWWLTLCHTSPSITNMSTGAWNELPADLQKMVLASVDRLSITIVEELEKLDKNAVVEAKKKGITVISWPEEEVAKFRKIAESQWPKWANSPTAKVWSDAVAAYWKSKE